jgi:hypothetical protein
MNKILSDDFILVTSSGKVVEKQQLLNDAPDREATYEHQEDTERNVRVWRDTAVVTSKLSKEWAEVNLIDYTLWFSDTYNRMPARWRYVFGQASLPLPKALRSRGNAIITPEHAWILSKT